jgi:hypothetical protein
MTQNTTKHLDRPRASIGGLGAMTFATCLTALGLAACGGGGGGDGRAAESPAAEAAASPTSQPEADRADGRAADSPAVRAAASPASPLDADGAVDVCALITPADLSAAFGETFDAGELTHHEGMGGDQCIWNLADPTSVGMVSLTVQRDSDLPAEVHDSGIDAERLFDEARRLMHADGVDMALGDKAYTSGSEVHVLYDDAVFDFMTLGDTPEDIAALQSLATSTIEALTA